MFSDALAFIGAISVIRDVFRTLFWNLSKIGKIGAVAGLHCAAPIANKDLIFKSVYVGDVYRRHAVWLMHWACATNNNFIEHFFGTSHFFRLLLPQTGLNSI